MLLQALPPARSSSTDSTETVRPSAMTASTMDAERDRGRLNRPGPRKPSLERSRDRTSGSVATTAVTGRRPSRSSSTSARATSRNPSNPALRPLSPTSIAPSSRSKPRSSLPSASSTSEHAPQSAAPSRRPSLTLSTKLLQPTSSTSTVLPSPSPSPSPSRLCPALSLPNEASIQISSVVVEGELDVPNEEDHSRGVNGNSSPSGGGGGVREMLETLRDKGTLIQEEGEGIPESFHDLQIPGLSQPFVLPTLGNPLLPGDRFDCTNTISIPDLPPTGSSSSSSSSASQFDEEDEVMNTMLPSPISPNNIDPTMNPFFVQAQKTEVGGGGGRNRPRLSNNGGGGGSSRRVSFSFDGRAISPPPPPRSSVAPTSRRSSGSILKPLPAPQLGKRRQLEPTTLSSSSPPRLNDTAEELQEVLIDRAVNANVNAKKRPALISYTSFEEEYGLKPPRLDTDYDDQVIIGRGVKAEEEEGKEEDGNGKKESGKKWWHLSV
ncbi:uncharacterized protein JCM6883_003385 [Sporobolomyces salmoneus]|uniref:uncharacterized protein n=1 Tax=Sporobolomyces salmoneus TaxID=183962 RepID=UPI00316CC18F